MNVFQLLKNFSKHLDAIQCFKKGKVRFPDNPGAFNIILSCQAEFFLVSLVLKKYFCKKHFSVYPFFLR